jgi:hypothetical protein
MKKAIVVSTEDKTSHDTSFSQRLIQSKALTPFNSSKAERSENAAEFKFEVSRGWLIRYKEDAISTT